ncbi:MAG: hypothetical protein LBC27_07355 [Spirochaetaceae bacterium]|jgi:DNA recombination protein RmuC|nr:hypothetical protein [Spirochaetaceae bacterium]
MDTAIIIGLILLALVIIQFVIMLVLFSKNKQASQADVSQKLLDYAQRLDKNESTVRDEFGKNREQSNKSAKEAREELSASLKTVSEQLSGNIRVVRKLQFPNNFRLKNAKCYAFCNDLGDNQPGWRTSPLPILQVWLIKKYNQSWIPFQQI